MFNFVIYLYYEIYDFTIVDCEWDIWSAWSTCSITCGTGSKIRIRRIQSYEENGGTCTGDSIEVSQVDCGTCPVGNNSTILISLRKMSCSIKAKQERYIKALSFKL